MKPSYKRYFTEALREVRVEFDDGSSLETSMAAGLTDEEIADYYKVGKTFNIGSGEKDKMVKVKRIKILK